MLVCNIQIPFLISKLFSDKHKCRLQMFPIIKKEKNY